MTEIKVSRRLVKSPPELWAEVSDAEALARRLGDLGEIRIARLEPETTVAWEGEHARGTVAIEGSGWGTAVTISARRNAPEPVAEPVVAETPGPPVPTPDPAPPTPAPDPAPPAPAPDPTPPTPAPDPGPPGPPGPGPQMEAAPETRSRGFFARLFPRRVEPAAEPAEPVAEPVVEVPGPDPAPLPDPDPLPDPAPLPDPDPPAAAAAGPSEPEVRAVLERMLDDLGAAHHRPFSRG